MSDSFALGEVGNWQRFLNGRGVTLPPLVVDEAFGPKTYAATKAWQSLQAIPETGVLDKLTRKLAVDAGFVAFVAAKYYGSRPTGPMRRVRLITIHTAECKEGLSAAESVATYFSVCPVVASAHYVVDPDSVVQCVRDRDVAYHASEVNDYSIGIEHDGFARQTLVEWQDSTSRATLARSARLVARLISLYEIPLMKAEPADIFDGSAVGLCGHVDVSRAFHRANGHTDPGAAFPWPQYLALVRGAL